MTKAEIKPRYTEAAARARCKPTESELAVWYSQLGHGDIRDLRTAINRHFEKITWMPRESELKPLMEAARNERESAQREPEEMSAWRCTDCKTAITSFRIGFFPRQCSGLISHGPNRGKACLGTTFNLMYRGSSR